MSAINTLHALIFARHRQAAAAARALGITPQYLADMLNGRRRISAQVAVACERVFEKPGLARDLMHAQIDEEIERLLQ